MSPYTVANLGKCLRIGLRSEEGLPRQAIPNCALAARRLLPEQVGLQRISHQFGKMGLKSITWGVECGFWRAFCPVACAVRVVFLMLAHPSRRERR